MLAIFAAVILAAAPQNDTVFTTDGGRVVGLVVEEGPDGVAIRLPDGSFRRYERRDVKRIEYADGSISRITEPPPAEPPPAAQAPPKPPSPPPQAYPPPPGYLPPPPRYAYGPPPRPPPDYRAGPLQPFYLSFGFGGAFRGGDAESSVEMDQIFRDQWDLDFEGGFRLSPRFALGLYADFGVGDAASGVQGCGAGFDDCTATTTRFGLLLRHTFAPAARMTPWISLGTGLEYGGVERDFDGSEFTYSGWEIARLQTGIDFRTNGVVGIGFYAGVAVGRYLEYEDDLVDDDLDDREELHSTIAFGIRFTLFP
jgi:hypothetical protein